MSIFKKGFTMMELMVVVVIVAVLLAIAVPSYLSYMHNSRRSDAIQALLSIQLAQEKYRVNNSTYGTLAQVWSGVSTTDGGYYSLAITVNTATAYTITATAVGKQIGDTAGGVSCNTLTLAYNNGVTTKTPTACWIK